MGQSWWMVYFKTMVLGGCFFGLMIVGYIDVFCQMFFKLIMTVFIYSFAYLFICLRYARCLSLSIVYLCLEHVETFANPQSCFEQ